MLLIPSVLGGKNAGMCPPGKEPPKSSPFKERLRTRKTARCFLSFFFLVGEEKEKGKGVPLRAKLL